MQAGKALAAVAALAVTAGSVQGQSREERAYLRSAAGHFGVGGGEVVVLAQGGASTAEIPVVLHIANGAGVSAEAVLALRRDGRSWSELLRRYGMHAGQLHVRLEGSPETGPLASAYAAFAERPRTSWSVISLSDEAVVSLVNLRFMAEYLELSPDRVAQALTRNRDPVDAYRELLAPRMS
jgi:hypothetical protein